LNDRELLKGAEEGDEFLLMGLRLREGIDPERYRLLTGRPIDLARTGRLLEQGFIEILRNRNIRASAQGVPVLDAVVADLAM
jgi:oxygen-independent coproporphyrinogen-3 oxidase